MPLTVDGKVMGSIAEEEGAGPDGDRPDLPTYYPSDYYTGQYEHTPTSVKGIDGHYLELSNYQTTVLL